MDKRIINSSAYKGYVKSTIEVHKYLKNGICPPNDVDKEYKSAIYLYEQFLDDNGYKMPVQKYPYSIEDKTTWKFIDVKITGDRHNDTLKSKSVLNPDYRY
jgi:hypothetical protein